MRSSEMPKWVRAVVALVVVSTFAMLGVAVLLGTSVQPSSAMGLTVVTVTLLRIAL